MNKKNEEAPPPSYETIMQTSLEENLTEATLTAEATNKILADLDKMEFATFYSYRYSFSQTKEAKVDEVVQKVPIASYLAKVTTQESDVLEDIFDVFNDRIDYKKFSTWADVVEKNKQLALVTMKCDMLRDKESTRRISAQLRINLSRIHDVVRRVHTSITSQQSRKEEMLSLAAQIDELSGKMKAVAGVMVDVEMDSDILAGRVYLKSVLQDWYFTKATLLYRASRDGFSAAKFHNKCDHQGATLTLISSDANVFGGYTSVSWTSCGTNVSDPSASLFSLVNLAGAEPTLYQVANDMYSIYDDSKCGPCFGEDANDLCIGSDPDTQEDNYCGFPNSYSDTTGRGDATFTGSGEGWVVDEIEVFRVEM